MTESHGVRALGSLADTDISRTLDKGRAYVQAKCYEGRMGGNGNARQPLCQPGRGGVPQRADCPPAGLGYGSPDEPAIGYHAPLGSILTALHPDCEGTDLPFRLEGWASEPKTGRVVAQRYIRTWSGKQKRGMDR